MIYVSAVWRVEGRVGAEIKVGDSRGSWTSGDAEVKGFVVMAFSGRWGISYQLY